MSPRDEERRLKATGQYRWLLERLDQFRHYLKSMTLLESAVNGLLGLIILAPMLFLLDNWLHFAPPARLGAFLLLAAAATSAIQTGVRFVFQPWGYERLALRIEERFPQLENRLINAVQLGALDDSTPGFELIQAIVSQSVEQVRSMKLRRAVDTRRLKRAAWLSAALALAAAAYPVFLPAYFRNAALRILMPVSKVAPITRTSLDVRPGDAAVGRGETLTIAAVPSGQLPRMAKLEVRGESAKGDFTMGFNGQQFEYDLTDIQTPLSYRVCAGDFASPWHAVQVMIKPRVARIAAKIVYPDYTRLSPSVADPSDGNVVALIGSKVTLTVWTNKPISGSQFQADGGFSAFPVPREAALPAESGEKAGAETRVSRLEVEIPVKGDTVYRWIINDSDRLTNQPEPQYNIKATPDAPPRAVITSPRGQIEVCQGEEVPVLFSVSDDYGLMRVGLFEEAGERQSALFERRFEQSERLFSEGVTVQTKRYNVGDEVKVFLDALDTNPLVPGRTTTDAVILKIVAPRSEAKDVAEGGANFAAQLLALLEAQREARSELKLWTVSLRAAGVEPAARAAALKKAAVDQSQVRAAALQMLDIALPSDSGWTQAKTELGKLAEAEMRTAAEQLRTLDPAGPAETVGSQANGVIEIQTVIIQRLSALLEMLRAAYPELEETLEAEQAKLEEGKLKEPESTTDLMGKVLDFIDDQEGVLASLQKMENIDPKNLTDKQRQELEDLAKKEDEWAEYFKDCADWLRKSPMVDGTESGLRDELIEMNIEIEKLPEELRSSPVTIPVAEETTKNGLELAEELTHNLEKWLAEEPDYAKWVLENSSQEYQVPLAELPDELEDMMGDLLESEQDMSQQIEDATSNWADSLDKGAGWEALDGPISNYSAKGVTGNLLPNDMDISGRAGEGRTGRSLGEMVESVATGKGGRDTQTRITADAMGQGQVEDLSTEEVKGATGGGKVAGTTGWGLVSANAPNQPEMIQKLSQRQSDLKMKALDLSKTLSEMQMPTGSLQQAIQGMDQVGKALSSGRYDNLKDLHGVVVSDLKSQRNVVRQQMKLQRDPSFGRRNQLQHEMRQSGEEDFPEEYRKLLSAYYEALSQQNW